MSNGKPATGNCVVAHAEEIARAESEALSSQDTTPRSRSRVMTPFIVQQGTQLFMLAAEAPEWVLAELRFDEANLVFTEVRKAHYAWPREAFGSLLSRIAVADDVDSEMVDQTAAKFVQWLGAQFQLSSGES